MIGSGQATATAHELPGRRPLGSGVHRRPVPCPGPAARRAAGAVRRTDRPVARRAVMPMSTRCSATGDWAGAISTSRPTPSRGRPEPPGRGGRLLAPRRPPAHRQGAARPHAAATAHHDRLHAPDRGAPPTPDRRHRDPARRRSRGARHVRPDRRPPRARCPVTVIAELLGIPEADRGWLRPWSRDMTLVYELNPSAEDRARGGDRRRASSRRTCATSSASAAIGQRVIS